MHRVAVLSEILGNRWALEAVLADAQSREAERVFNLGDSLYGPLDPAGTANLLMNPPIPMVQLLGDRDRWLLENASPQDFHPSRLFDMYLLDSAHIQWLAELPSMLVEDSIRALHGSLLDDQDFLIEIVTPSGLRRKNLETLSRLLGDLPEEVILCGQSHVPQLLQLPQAKLILNPGSVGLQAYVSGEPHFFAVENRSPHARYALLEKQEWGWTTSLMAVAYDWETAARAADRNGWPEWGRALRSGWA